ncbi:hypothetical protein [Hydrogenovibrio kuenenii]|uniref:hypothetical protein n=1 Tax=Hydrogenovibrio kuenenii TaxID=63658 RepID=UPI00046330FF|nr:hypothetical protein [Hydrogenovibrio kuenenii]
MIKQTLLVSALACTFSVFSANAFAAPPPPPPVYGGQLMTQQERNAYRTKMQSAQTQEERNQIRNEHHKQMQERAKAQGITLPDNPPENRGPGNRMRPGSGMGPGGGMGPGMMRPGGGMGPGGGPNR